MIQMILVDDHAIVRSGLQQILQQFPQVNVIAEAESGEQAVSLCRQLQPDIVLMDVHMPKGMGGIEASRRLLQDCPELKIIILTMQTAKALAQQLIKIGVQGYLTKDSSPDELSHAIQQVFRGGRYLSADVSKELAWSFSQTESVSFEDLSQRELQVAWMIIHGQSNQEIGDILALSPKTISTYRRRIFEKLGVKNDVELLKLALQAEIGFHL